jgi:hypothetical protein
MTKRFTAWVVNALFLTCPAIATAQNIPVLIWVLAAVGLAPISSR